MSFQVVSIHTDPFIVGALGFFLLLLFAVFAKVIFAKLGVRFIPESSLIILVGCAVGAVAWLITRSKRTNAPVLDFDPHTFFLILIPPIILEAGYFLRKDFFVTNLGTILLFAVLGTLTSSFAVGLTLYGLSGLFEFPFSFSTALAFGSLISAVDPVAVLAIFEEVHVNEQLDVLVFGESVLNDAVAIVLYNLFSSLDSLDADDLNASLAPLAILRFFLVAIGGTGIGVLCAIGGAWATKYTACVPVLEPLIVFSSAYLAYVAAELTSLSGIMAILFSGMMLSRYVEANINRKSHTALKYVLKMTAISAETIIFLILGVQLVLANHHWDTAFALLSYFFCTLYRFVIVFALSNLANAFRRNKLQINKRSMFTMSYGGLRGAIAFALAFNLPPSETRDAIITTTLFVIMVTVFFQGSTMKPLLNMLHVRLANADHKHETVAEQVFGRGMTELTEAMAIIHGHPPVWYSIRSWLVACDAQLQRFLLRGPHLEEKQLIDSLNHLRELDAQQVLRDEERRDYVRAHKHVHQLVHSSGVNLQHVLRKVGGRRGGTDFMARHTMESSSEDTSSAGMDMDDYDTSSTRRTDSDSSDDTLSNSESVVVLKGAMDVIDRKKWQIGKHRETLYNRHWADDPHDDRRQGMLKSRIFKNIADAQQATSFYGGLVTTASLTGGASSSTTTTTSSSSSDEHSSTESSSNESTSS